MTIKHKDIYEHLKKNYTDEEIVENFVFPSDMTNEEREKSQKEFGAWRMERWRNRTPEEKLLGGLLGLKYRIKSYTKQDQYDKSKTTASYLKEYLDITNRTTKNLAEELNMQETTLIAILNQKEKIDPAISFRLERHSGDIIPALYWWKLLQKELEYEFYTKEELRKIERLQVKKVAYRA